MFHNRFFKWVSAALVGIALAAMLTLALASAALAQPPANSRVYPTTARPFGRSYTAWSVAWWQWALALPVERINKIADALTGRDGTDLEAAVDAAVAARVLRRRNRTGDDLAVYEVAY